MERRQRHLLFGIALLTALVAGAAAGIVASVTLSRSLGDYAAQLLLAQMPATPSGTVPRANPSSYDDALDRIANLALPSVALVTATTIDSRNPASWIAESDAVGYGAVVSTDGWVLLTDDALRTFDSPLTQADVWVDGVRYEITQAVADTLTEFVLVKIDANGLRPAAFGASDEVADGTQLFVAQGTHALRTTSLLTAMAGKADVLPAERYAYRWDLLSIPGESSPVFGASGDLLGLTTTVGALPVHASTAFVQSVFRDGVPTHAGFGATVVDLSAPLNIEANLSQGRDEGALIMTIVRSGPAADAGLLEGDIVTAVDDVRIDASTTLAELLRSYRPGDRATVSVMRGGAMQTMDVMFGAYGDLVY